MIYPFVANGDTVMIGTEGSILWMVPGLAEQQAKIKHGTRAEPHVGRSRRRTFA